MLLQWTISIQHLEFPQLHHRFSSTSSTTSTLRPPSRTRRCSRGPRDPLPTGRRDGPHDLWERTRCREGTRGAGPGERGSRTTAVGRNPTTNQPPNQETISPEHLNCHCKRVVVHNPLRIPRICAISCIGLFSQCGACQSRCSLQKPKERNVGSLGS